MSVTVYLVGAGPGDPGLLTVRGRELLMRADAVVYDYLASPALLALARPDAQLVYVGKKGFSQHMNQDEVNALLVDKACEVEGAGGTCVVRLKGGDPFLFGRGGEEALALVHAGVPFEIVPGVTSGIAACAYAGIPVTHRGVSSSVTFVTGHEDPEKESSDIDWIALARLAQLGGTICFYMGMRNLGQITHRLTEAGLDADTPLAIVQWGTTPAQRALVSTVGEALSAARASGLGAPAIIAVGQVASLHDVLPWFESRPLFGKRIVVTRARTQASVLSSRLVELGADVVEFPTIEVQPPEDFGPLDAALLQVGSYDWIVFTSANGVDAFFGRLQGDARALSRALVAAIGPATARRLLDFGVKADAVPREYRGEAVHEAMQDACRKAGTSLAGKRVLLARAQEAREALPQLLRESGAQVDVVAAYRTVAPSDFDAASLAAQLREGRIDGVTFTSSSTVRNACALLGKDAGALADARLFSIGPITTKTLADAGFADVVEASEYTVAGIVDAIVDCGIWR